MPASSLISDPDKAVKCYFLHIHDDNYFTSTTAAIAQWLEINSCLPNQGTIHHESHESLLAYWHTKKLHGCWCIVLFIGEVHRCTKISLKGYFGAPVHFTDEYNSAGFMMTKGSWVSFHHKHKLSITSLLIYLSFHNKSQKYILTEITNVTSTSKHQNIACAEYSIPSK